LPPAQPALIYYPYAASEKFPLVGSSSRCAIGGPVYHRSDFKDPKRPYPDYYDGKWLMADYSRFWIMTVSLDENGNYKSMERFAPDYHPVQPLDTKFGPDGDLYVLEYGSNTTRSAVESRLVRIEYNAGNRKPVVNASARKKGGAIPFTTTLISAGTKDYDNDKLNYQWKIYSGKDTLQKFNTPNPEVKFELAGVYTASLTVTDAKGESNSSSIRIIAGNEPPDVSLKYNGNKTFFFDNGIIDYKVDVEDKEDGSLSTGKISPDEVAVSIDYASEGFDLAPVMLEHADLDRATRYAVAETFIKNNDCRSCHTRDVKVVGPSFKQIAEKYRADPKAVDDLAGKIRGGSSGVWGIDNNMPSHPSISINDARTIVNYILNINNESNKTLPVKGKYVTKIPKDDNGRGVYILRAAYTDKGAGAIPAQTTDTVIVLHSPKLVAIKADVIENGAIRDQLDEYIFLSAKPNSFIAFRNIDMTGIKQILFRPNWHLYDIYPGGKVEIHLDKPDGELIGETELQPEQFNTRYRGAFGGLSNPTKEQQLRMKKYPKLNERQFFSRGADKNSFVIPSIATVKQQKGIHDIYFVFKNDAVHPKESLFPLAEIEFIK
jgi:cytochrome c